MIQPIRKGNNISFTLSSAASAFFYSDIFYEHDEYTTEWASYKQEKLYDYFYTVTRTMLPYGKVRLVWHVYNNKGETVTETKLHSFLHILEKYIHQKIKTYGNL